MASWAFTGGPLRIRATVADIERQIGVRITAFAGPAGRPVPQCRRWTLYAPWSKSGTRSWTSGTGSLAGGWSRLKRGPSLAKLGRSARARHFEGGAGCCVNSSEVLGDAPCLDSTGPAE